MTREARIHKMRKTQYLWQVMLGKLGSHMYVHQESKHSLIPYTKINLKWRKSLNIRHYRTPGREHRQNILWHKLYQCFLRSVCQAIKVKAKINKWDLIKLICFCTAKETIHKRKRQPIEQEEIFASDVADKGLIPKICKWALSWWSSSWLCLSTQGVWLTPGWGAKILYAYNQKHKTNHTVTSSIKSLKKMVNINKVL